MDICHSYSELHVLNKAIIYARDNELCDRVIICHVHRRHGTSSRRGLEHGVQGPSQQSRHTCGTGHADVDSDNDSPSSSAVATKNVQINNDDHKNHNDTMMMTPHKKGLGHQSVSIIDTTTSISKGPQLLSAQATREQRLQRHNDLFLSIREHQRHPDHSFEEVGNQWQRELHNDGSSNIHPVSHTNTPQLAGSRKQRSSSFMVGDRDRNQASGLHTHLQPMVDAGAHEDLASALGLPVPPPPPSNLATISTSPLVHGRKTIMPTSALEDSEALLQEDRQHNHRPHDYHDYGDNGLLSERDETISPDTTGTTTTAEVTDEETDGMGGSDEICKRLQENLTLLDHIYPKCKVDLLLVESDEFCPALVAQLSRDLGIQPSFMFIRW